MGTVAFLLVKESIAEIIDSQVEKEKVFQNLDIPDVEGRVVLLNKGIDVSVFEISDEDFLYVELNSSNEVSFSGEWINGLSNDFCSIYGSMTFVISEMEDEDHYYQLKDIYGALWVKSNLTIVEAFMARGLDWVNNFIYEYEEETPENDEIRSYWELFQELSEESGEDYETIIQTLGISYAFHQMGISVEEDSDKRTLICSLNGMLSLKKFLLYKEVLEDEMSELEGGDSFQFAYSIWTGSYNTDLFENLGIDNGNYLSFPTLKVGNFSAELETGSWY